MSEPRVVIATCYGTRVCKVGGVPLANELVKENEEYRLLSAPAVAYGGEAELELIAGTEYFVIIEGCPVMCCSKIMEDRSGIKPNMLVILEEDYGVEKASLLVYDAEKKERIKTDIRKRIEEALAGR
jgi:uncharacterized metal-binding protein